METTFDKLEQLQKEIRKYIPNVWFTYISEFQLRVFVGWREVGAIAFGKHKRQDKELYSVESQSKILNQKAPYHEKTSVHMRPVLLECVRCFAGNTPKETAREVQIAQEAIASNLSKIVDSHRASISMGNVLQKFSNGNEIQHGLLRFLIGEPDALQNVSLDFKSEEDKEILKGSLSNYMIAKSLQEEQDKRKGYAVVITEDETYVVADLSKPTEESRFITETKDFSKLPEIVQQKITPLKLLEQRECLRNMGVKLFDSDGLYNRFMGGYMVRKCSLYYISEAQL